MVGSEHSLGATAEHSEENPPWEQELATASERIALHFPRAETRTHVRAYLAGLLANIERRNGWQLSRATGSSTPYALQHIVGRAIWDAEAVRDDLQIFVRDSLLRAPFNLRFGQIGFAKKGSRSAGVRRQFNRTTSRIENCQVGMFVGCVTDRDCVLIDRALYLPPIWMRDISRRRRVGIPDELKYASKAELVSQMLCRALDAGFEPEWVVSESGQDADLRTLSMLEARAQPYVIGLDPSQLAARNDNLVPQSGVVLAGHECDWKGVEIGGLERFQWTMSTPCNVSPSRFRSTLCKRDTFEVTKIDHYAVFAPATCQMTAIIRAIADRPQVTKGVTSARVRLGLDQYEVRSWSGWQRHVTLVLWAQALLGAYRLRTTSPRNAAR